MKLCKGYRKLIGAYVDDTATEAERAQLREHLARCEACARAVRELKHTRELVRGLPRRQPSSRLVTDLSRRLRQQRVSWLERVWWSLTPADWRVSVAVSVLLLLCVTTGLLTLRGPFTITDQAQHQILVAQMYAPTATGTAEFSTDDYLASCILIHETFDQDSAFGHTDGIQLASYAP